MKNISPSVRRILGLVIALVAGTLATLVVATPASAHSNKLTSTWHCDSTTGNFVVTWTLANDQVKWSGTIQQTQATPASSTVTGFDVGTSFPTSPGTIAGVQTVPGTATTANLAVRSTWADGWPHNAKYGWAHGDPVEFKTTCTQNEPKPGVSFTSKCDGSVTATLSVDSAATHSVAFTIVANGKSSTTTVAVGASSPVVIPAANAGNISVAVGSYHLADYSWKVPADCAALKVSPKSDCTTLAILLDNPAGNAPVTVTVSVNAPASAPKTVTVPAGGSQTVTFNAAAGTIATVTFGSGAAAAARVAAAAAAAATAPVTFSWVSPGATCSPTTPPSLPQTGAKLGGIIGAGAGLIVVGAGLLLFLRRRRNIAAVR